MLCKHFIFILFLCFRNLLFFQVLVCCFFQLLSYDKILIRIRSPTKNPTPVVSTAHRHLSLFHSMNFSIILLCASGLFKVIPCNETWKKWAICQALGMSIKSFNKTILKWMTIKNGIGNNFYWLRRQLALPDRFCILSCRLLIWLTLMKFSCLWNRSYRITGYFSKPTKPTAEVGWLSICVSVDCSVGCAYSAPQWIWLEIRSARNWNGGIMSHWRSSVSICIGEGTLWAYKENRTCCPQFTVCLMFTGWMQMTFFHISCMSIEDKV